MVVYTVLWWCGGSLLSVGLVWVITMVTMGEGVAWLEGLIKFIGLKVLDVLINTLCMFQSLFNGYVD